MRLAHANAETAKVPVITVPGSPNRRRTHVGLLAAATVVVVGASAVTLGVISTNSSPVRPTAVAASAITDVDVAVAASGSTQEGLAANLHNELAVSLPRIQAATSEGMREGSGLFVTPTGHIVTSAGLVADAEYIIAWTDDGRRWEATLIAADRFSDVAVLHIDSEEWPQISIGSDRTLRSGQYALAIDYAAATMSVGEVSAVVDTVNIDEMATATRIAIDQPTALPGSAILDDAGFVIAMVTSSDGSLATPAWMIERVALDLIALGVTSHAWLGLETDNGPSSRALTIDKIAPGSPAERAGLRVGDYVDSVNGEEVLGDHSLWTAVETSRPGDELEIMITRFGDQHILNVTLDEAVSD